MYNYPFFSFPRFRRYSSYGFNQSNVAPNPSLAQNSYHNHPIGSNNGNYIRKPFLSDYSSNSLQKSYPDNSSDSFNRDNFNASCKSKDEFFEIFGVKLYYDDILLICLIFFLYQEGVQDQYLFTALILLLLS